jgi:hypothetical protein
VTDVDERRRASDPRLRQAIKGSTAWWAIVRYGKRGRTRAIPLDEDALAAIAAWIKSRPPAATEHLLLSLPRTAQPRPLSTRDIARIVARHAATAGLPDDRRSPHVLRHTFCTHLADAGADTAVIRELAGHADTRTTTIYTAVNPPGSNTPSPYAAARTAAPAAPPPAPELRRRALARDRRRPALSARLDERLRVVVRRADAAGGGYYARSVGFSPGWRGLSARAAGSTQPRRRRSARARGAGRIAGRSARRLWICSSGTLKRSANSVSGRSASARNARGGSRHSRA